MPIRIEKLPEEGKKESIEKPTTETGSKLVSYNYGDVELALRSLALNGANYQRTARELEQQHDLAINPQTLSKWHKVSFAQRYEEICADLKKEIGDRLSNQLISNAQDSAAVTQDIVARLHNEVNELETSELSRAAKDLTTVTGSSIDKAALLRGQPTEIRQDNSPEAIVEELRRLGVSFGSKPIDGEAKELED
jgi:hypothetical protein